MSVGLTFSHCRMPANVAGLRAEVRAFIAAELGPIPAARQLLGALRCGLQP